MTTLAMASVAFERDEIADGKATPIQRRFPRRALDNRLAMETGETFSFNRFERQQGHNMKTKQSLVDTVDTEQEVSPDLNNEEQIRQGLEQLAATDSSILGLLRTLLSFKTLPHVIALVLSSVFLYALANSSAGMAAVAFASLAVGYSVTAMLSSIERIRSWTQLSDWGEERPNALKRLAFSFRILILPYSVAAVFFLSFLAFTSESAPDVLALIMASLFVVWAIAQGRSFGAWASAQSAKGTPKRTATSGQGYLGLSVLVLGVVGFSGAAITLFASIHDPTDIALAQHPDLFPFIGLSLLVFGLMNAATWKIRAAAMKHRSLRRFHFKWSIWIHLFVTWHLLTVYRHAFMDIGDLEVYLEEITLMMFTVFMGIWSLTSKGFGAKFKLLNTENALPWGLAFGYAYAGSVAMISAAVGDLRMVMMLGHILAALTGVWMHRSILNSVLVRHQDELEIQHIVAHAEAATPTQQQPQLREQEQEPVLPGDDAKDNWNEHLDGDWEKPKDIGLKADVEWEDVINIDD